MAPLPSPAAWTEEEDRRGYFGPGSVTWRIHGDPAHHLGGMRALMLQALHPVAMDGVARNSAGFKDDWWMRIARTGEYMDTVVFGTRAEGRRLAARVRGYHRKLSGVEETTGRAYRVDDPDLLLWVHNCAVESMLTTARRAGVPLTDEDADRYVAEQVVFAQLVGVPLETVPTTVAALDAYFAGIRPALAATPAAVRGVRDLFLPPMPGWLQVLTPARPVWGGLAGLCFALLPAWARQLYSLPGLALTDAAATAGVKAFRAAFLALPDRAHRSPIVRAGYARTAATRAA
ncbi:DUF2236 domain-containing protein [Blastococcus sp. KM273128]|nr:DUF2236 domain-containing protein [Blastococcus sp. KM273128]